MHDSEELGQAEKGLAPGQSVEETEEEKRPRSESQRDREHDAAIPPPKPREAEKRQKEHSLAETDRAGGSDEEARREALKRRPALSAHEQQSAQKERSRDRPRIRGASVGPGQPVHGVEKGGRGGDSDGEPEPPGEKENECDACGREDRRRDRAKEGEESGARRPERDTDPDDRRDQDDRMKEVPQRPRRVVEV